jgi:ABC-type uncharacterized transport system
LLKSHKPNQHRANRLHLVAGLSLLLLSGCHRSGNAPVPRQELTVMSGLPLFWKEGDTAAALAKTDQRAPITQALSKHFRLLPIDVLTADELKSVKLLMLAQPRMLLPSELVALDNWVQRGGQVLIFADPRLDWPSSYPMGDARRAPPVTLLDPLFGHWGLDIQAREAELASPLSTELAGKSAKLISYGRWTTKSKACALDRDRVVARCRIGSGRAVLVGDVDILDLDSDNIDGSANAEAVTAQLAALQKGES